MTEILKTKKRLDVSVEGKLDALTSPEREEKMTIKIELPHFLRDRR